MRILSVIVISCFVTTLTAAPLTHISISPDGRYIVNAHLMKRSNISPAKERPDPSRSIRKEQGVGLELFDHESGETILLVDGDAPGSPPPTRLSEFKAIWSPDSRYVALSGPFNEMTISHNMSPGADPGGRIWFDPHSTSNVLLCRVEGKVLPVRLPPYQIFATHRRLVVQRGEVVDHWEGTRALWTANRREGKLYRYKIHRKIFPW